MLILNKIIRSILILSLAFILACQTKVSTIVQQDTSSLFSATSAKPKLSEIQSEEIRKLLESVIEQTNQTKSYDPKYVVISYPNGDVPIATGVCTDVVIRAFRKAGVRFAKGSSRRYGGEFFRLSEKMEFEITRREH
jgi:uncharacterized protein YijF (DUF1287 family)